MREQRPSPDRLAVVIADGGPVDWDDALASASDDEERRVIRQLRLVESVARVHRSAGSSASDKGVPPTMTASVDRPTWGHLELRERLGQGAFGEVYRAWESRLDREVALKLLKTQGPSEKAFATAIVEEGRLLAKLRHPNVVTVYGAEIRHGRVGLWMELIRGRALEQLLRDQGPFGAREAALIGVDLCRALAAVHGAGVIHRDVKAQNVMREEGGRIVLTDFGAGIDVRAETDDRERAISGTPFYMAPEVVRGEPATQRSDIYSLGVLMYRLVTATFPIEATSWNELRKKHAHREATLLRDRRPDLPEGFVAVVERALAWAPEDRFATAGQMEQALSVALGAAGGSAVATPHSQGGGWRRFRLRLAWGPLQVSIVAAAVVAGIALLSAFRVPQRSVPISEHPPAPTGPSYTVEAALYRVRANASSHERLEPGARLDLGDRLTLEFNASAPLLVYVIDEVDAGHAYALFPLPGLDQGNPLQPGTTHVLPGSREGRNLSWKVDTPGGREHLLVVASPARLVEFEAEMNALARPGQVAVSIPEYAKVHLRGIGGLAESSAGSPGRSARPLFEMAEQLASRSEVVNGVWVRRIELENPPP